MGTICLIFVSYQMGQAIGDLQQRTYQHEATIYGWKANDLIHERPRASPWVCGMIFLP